MILSSWGSAWGTWRAGLGVCHMGIDHPEGIIKNIVPIVMAGVLGIYGLIVSVIITQSISSPGGDGYNTYSIFNGYVHVSFSNGDICEETKPRQLRCRTSFVLVVLTNLFPSETRLACCRIMLWTFMSGSRRHHWNYRRCRSKRIRAEGRRRTKVVLGRGPRRRRWRLWRIQQCRGIE